MRAKAIVRVAAPVAVSAVMAAAWPAMPHAAAATALVPDGGSSSIAYANGSTSLLSAPAHAIRGLSTVTVAFTGDNVPITQSWTDYTTNFPNPTPESSYICLVKVGSTSCQGSGTTSVNGNTMQLTVAANTPDGTYQIYAMAWPASCSQQPLPPSSCQSDHWAGLVPNSSSPFTFTLDNTPPAAPVVSAPAAIDANSVHAVTISGTAEPGSNVFVTVNSTGGGATFFANPGGTTAGPDGSWSIAPSLASVPDGTLTINVTASDVAGNVSAPGSPSPAPVLAARPSSPRNLTTVGGDTAIGLLWNPPTSSGGHPITGYTITYTDTTAGTPAQTAAAAASATTALISNVVNGHAYAVTIAATNDVGAGAAATAAVTPRSRSGLYVTPSYGVVNYGKTITLLGRLTTSSTSDTGIGNVPITVTTRYDNGAAGPTLHTTTDEFGYWQITGVRPAKDITYIATYAGDSANGPASATSKRVLVRALVRITKASASRLTGTVAPNERGRRVYVYELIGHRSVRIGSVTLSSSSAWTFRHSWSRGTHYVIAKFATQNGIQGGTSNRVKIVG